MIRSSIKILFYLRKERVNKNGVEINDALDSYQASMLKVYRAALERDNYVDTEKVKNIFLGFSVDNRTILSVFQEHIENTEKLVGKTASKATLQKDANIRFGIATERTLELTQRLDEKKLIFYPRTESR